MANRFLNQLIKTIQDENTSLAEDATSSAEYTGFIDTGSYIFNAQLSGSLYGGVPNTKALVLAGEQAVGKTFFAIGVVKNFLDTYPESVVIWYLAEPAVTKKMLVDRGIDPSRVVFAEPITVLEWSFHVVKTLDAYMESDDRPPMLMVLDSLGALSSEKEVDDFKKGEASRDMTRQQNIRGTFRVIDKKLAKAKVPMIITNHVYQVIGSYFPTKEVSGGGGIKYAGDLIAILSAAKERDDGEIVGNKIKIKMYKNRVAKQHTEIEVMLSYETGLNRYYGLLDLGEKHKVFKKIANKWEMPNGDKAFEKTIYKNPEKYFTPEVMSQLEIAAHKEFEYGQSENNTTEPTT